MRSFHITALLMLLACNDAPDDRPIATTRDSASPSSGARAAQQLEGSWTKDEYPSFIWSVSDSTILFESDMLEHPYTMSGDTIIIDPLDPAQPKQKTVILKLTPDLLVIRDAGTGIEEQLKRMR